MMGGRGGGEAADLRVDSILVMNEGSLVVQIAPGVILQGAEQVIKHS